MIDRALAFIPEEERKEAAKKSDYYQCLNCKLI